MAYYVCFIEKKMKNKNRLHKNKFELERSISRWMIDAKRSLTWKATYSIVLGWFDSSLIHCLQRDYSSLPVACTRRISLSRLVSDKTEELLDFSNLFWAFPSSSSSRRHVSFVPYLRATCAERSAYWLITRSRLRLWNRCIGRCIGSSTHGCLKWRWTVTC